jgi:predicted dehydrogenase/threonine dehydrogenase-like Zn-dependent dehydrogenase
VKQVLQDIRSGEIAVHELPEPAPAPGHALVAVRHSLISAGTERAMAGLGSKSLLQKARARPDLVRKTLDSAKSDGVAATLVKVRGRLDQYTAFGYSCAGEVLDTGGDPRLVVGGLVACVGQGYASHAEVVSVPTSLVVPLPDGVSTEGAAFAAPAAIALHAIRLAGADAGSVVAVVGLGLIGQLAGRLLHASGCRAVGTDPRADRRALFGPAGDDESVRALVVEASRGRGADAVIVCAATPSSGPMELAAELARDRASLVVVGDVGLDLDRRVFYERELSLVVARSYGPGRYDRAYEERGLDYPVGHVRWTEGRNVEAVLDLLSGQLHVTDLITHRLSVDEGARAYETLHEDPTAVGVLLEYAPAGERRRIVRSAARSPRTGALRVGVVGAGAFARGTLLPMLDGFDDVHLAAVCTRSGASAKSVGDRFGIPLLATDWRELVESVELDALVVATPHAEHAQIAAAALRAGNAVFVEKPLAIDGAGLAEVAEAAAGGGLLLVGHNRRFAPLAQQLHERIRPPLLVQIRVAAGSLPPGHWLEDPEQGGRILGEISHFVDLATFLCGAPPAGVTAQNIDGSLLGMLRFANGSSATIAYGVGESGKLSKERVEALGISAAAVIDDFERLEIFGANATTTKSKRNKGHRNQLRAFVDAALGRAELNVPVEEQLLVSAASLALLDSAASGVSVTVSLPS